MHDHTFSPLLLFFFYQRILRPGRVKRESRFVNVCSLKRTHASELERCWNTQEVKAFPYFVRFVLFCQRGRYDCRLFGELSLVAKIESRVSSAGQLQKIIVLQFEFSLYAHTGLRL